MHRKEAEITLRRAHDELEQKVEERTRELQAEIEERTEAETKLAESEKKYRDLVETALNIILIVTNDGIITFINEYGANFFGYSVDELIGENVMIIVPKTESTGRPLNPLIDDILARPDNHTVSVNENITRDGRRVWVNWMNKSHRCQRAAHRASRHRE